ncbi:hypothetical protein [Candidatus Methylocalor cossyra]|uniref:Uncharacterized protein n=1 Tax=Candidatus Methylocalor cossyra TaxID=3108543 RepID=A0ABP1CD22_9GAMM
MKLGTAAAATLLTVSTQFVPSPPVLAADGPGPGPRGDGPGCDLFPAPASVGTTIGLSYFGPPPLDPTQVGPVQLLRSGQVDVVKGTVTLPLYKGYLKNNKTPVWYILTDTNDQAQAAFLGLNFSAKLTYASNGARTAQFDQNNDLVFDAGEVDFSPARQVVPGPSDHPFPPQSAQAGSVGDRNYSPLVKVTNAGGIVFNAPIIAFGVDESEIHFPDGNVDYTKVHDAVVAIDPQRQTVTLQLVNGFSFGRALMYISLDVNDPVVAAVEGATYAPLLKNIPTGRDDSFTSPVERLFAALNGPQDCANPQRQGLFAALTDGHRPNNTFGGIPTIANDYSPLWDVNLYEWTPAAIDQRYRSQLREEFQILTLVQNGFLTGPGGSPFGSSGVIVNCPPVQRLF